MDKNTKAIERPYMRTAGETNVTGGWWMECSDCGEETYPDGLWDVCGNCGARWFECEFQDFEG